MPARSARAGDGLLTEVSEAAELAEGPEGVRKILWIVYKQGSISLRDLARLSRLPVPVASATRRELEKRSILERRKGISLSDKGSTFVNRELGIRSRREFVIPSCAETDLPDAPDLEPIRSALVDICANRPKVDVRLDQSHGTPETALRRALYMYERDALEGRDILILGDDDLLSVGLALLRNTLSDDATARGAIAVLELDSRVADYIGEISEANGMGIQCFEHDLRDQLPSALMHRFDVFATDPPYTVEGLELFVSRAIQALRKQKGKQGFISFAHKSPDEMLSIQFKLAEMGLFVGQIMPAFNRYEGSQVLAGCSQMMHVLTTARTRPTLTGPYRGPLYTADRKGAKGARRADG